jgi:single-strand DNA-binding protein
MQSVLSFPPLTFKENDMPSLNRVQLIGRLGRDPETRFTPTGKKVTSFSLAVDRRWRSSEGETKEATEWVNIEAWGRLGEVCQEFLQKGRLVFIEGRLQTDRYEQEGQTRFFTKVVASQMQMLDRRPDEEEAVPPPSEDEEFPFE